MKAPCAWNTTNKLGRNPVFFNLPMASPEVW
jgi:hypothetical protein